MPLPRDLLIPNLYAINLLFQLTMDSQPIIGIGCYISSMWRWWVFNATTLNQMLTQIQTSVVVVVTSTQGHKNGFFVVDWVQQEQEEKILLCVLAWSIESQQ